MAATPIFGHGRRVASGPSAAKAADALRRMQQRRDAWPFPWVYPPPEATPREPFGYVAVPAVSVTPTQILQYSVPSGLQFELRAIMFCAVNLGQVSAANPGDLLWTVNRNTPATGTVLQGSPLPDLQNVPFYWGSPLQGPLPLFRSLNFKGTDIIRVFVTNVAFGSPGAPNFAVAQLFGYEYKE